MLRHILPLAAAIALIVSPVRAGDFVEGIVDLPLMPGLQAAPGGSLVFDKPAGRIVLALATGTATQGEVARFYADTLPQLGWVAVDRAEPPTSYVRDGESLRLELAEDAGHVAVRFHLAPQ